MLVNAKVNRSPKKRAVSHSSRSADVNKAVGPRAIADINAALDLRIEYIPHPMFEKSSFRRAALNEMPTSSGSLELDPNATSGELGGYLRNLATVPLLSKEEEENLFLRMNYLKFAAAEIQRSLRRRRPAVGRIEEMSHLLKSSDEARDRIIRANLRLVISIAKKYVNKNNSFDELISEGNMSLIQAAEKFDISRGNRFSTYATRAIRNNLYHYVLNKHRRRQHVGLADDDALDQAIDHRADEKLCERRVRHVQHAVRRMLKRLDSQKQAIIESRFGIVPDGAPLTLKEIASEMGVSREHVRQIQTRAIRELRLYANEENIDFPDE